MSWNADLPDSGVVVGDDVLITLDIEAEAVAEQQADQAVDGGWFDFSPEERFERRRPPIVW